MNQEPDYSLLFKGRQEGFQTLGNIYNLPTIRSPYDFIKSSYRGGKILDVGSGTHFYIRDLLKLDDQQYYSLDNDPSGEFSFNNVDEIPQGLEFDRIVMNQLVEHLTIHNAFQLILGLYDHLKIDGLILATTPNIFHPNRFWGDPTHVTAWSHSALYGLFRIAKYKNIQVFRYSKNRGPVDPLSWIVERIMRRLYRIDWHDSIMLIAQK